MFHSNERNVLDSAFAVELKSSLWSVQIQTIDLAIK